MYALKLKYSFLWKGRGVVALMKVISLTQANQPLTPLTEVSQMLKPTLSETMQAYNFFTLKQNTRRALYS